MGSRREVSSWSSGLHRAVSELRPQRPRDWERRRMPRLEKVLRPGAVNPTRADLRQRGFMTLA